MLDKALISILIGAGISVVTFVPVLIHQFRRFGAPSFGRMVLVFSNFVYVTAIIAYTIFPVPPLSDKYCAAHPRYFILDPTEYFRDMAHQFAGAPVMEVLTSFSMMQMVLNVALFVPLGFYAVRLLRMRPWAAILLGFGTSLFIELTQYTGNWFISNCQYRAADVNDLITNTLGGILGVLTTTFAPHFSQAPEQMEKQANEPREVTKGRRFLALLIDAWWVAIIDLVALAVAVAIEMTMLYNNPESKTAIGDFMETYGTPLLMAINLVYVIVAMAGRLGVSPGMGTAHLVWTNTLGLPAGRRHSLVVGVAFMCSQLANTRFSILASIGTTVLVVEAISVLFTARGLIGKIMRLNLVDARTIEERP
ncbi:VanZ family protein [Cutibacterium sp. V947]|uniref:VanZ family protein n=1 Tax=Cutibacterium sp. V947 TaxID=3446480 RepID=UPI003EE1CBBD